MTAAPFMLDLPDADATQALGGTLARSLPGAVHSARASAVLYLRGELGAGKTCCVRGLLRSLGATGLIRSPTYTLAETYELGPITCLHVDLYRLQNTLEIEELGLRDALVPGSVLLVEWPEKGAGVLPAADLELELSYHDASRRARLCAATGLGIEWLANLGLHTR